MKRRVILVALLVIAFAAPVVVTADTSDAGDALPTYYKQLTDSQKAIYDELVAIDPDVEPEEVGPSPDGLTTYRYTVMIEWEYVTQAKGPDSGMENILDEISEDATMASMATSLDMPINLAFWAWTDLLPEVYIAGEDLQESEVEGISDYIYSVDKFTIYLPIEEAYVSGDGMTMPEKIDAAEEALEEIEISAESDVDKVEEINNLLCGSDYDYGDNDFCHSPYGALVHKEGGKHVIVCDGYSSLFKLLCDKAGIPCVMVVGWAAQTAGNEYHAWNVIRIDGANYGVDSTWNSQVSDNKSFLAVGSLTSMNGVTFSQSHQAFLVYNEEETGLQYHFNAPVIETTGYDWPVEETILTSIAAYTPWIIIGLICALLAYVLWSMGRNGE